MQGLAVFFQKWIFAPVIFTASFAVVLVITMFPLLIAASAIGLVTWLGLWFVHWIGLPLPL